MIVRFCSEYLPFKQPIPLKNSLQNTTELEFWTFEHISLTHEFASF